MFCLFHLRCAGLIYLLCLRYPTDGQVGRSPYYKIGGTRDMGQRLQAYVTSQPFAPEVSLEVGKKMEEYGPHIVGL